MRRNYLSIEQNFMDDTCRFRLLDEKHWNKIHPFFQITVKSFVQNFYISRNAQRKQSVAALWGTKGFEEERSGDILWCSIGVGESCRDTASQKLSARRQPLYSPCGEDNGLELGRVSRRRVKIGLRLAGSHYNNYGRAAGKLHASVPLTVSPG